MRRQTYQEFIEAHPSMCSSVITDHSDSAYDVGPLVKAQELDALSDAVRSENYRLHALEAQAR